MIYNVRNKDYNNETSYGYVCNECLAVFLAKDDFDHHIKKLNHSKEAIILDLLCCTRISENKVLALFNVPVESSSPCFADNEDSHSSKWSR